MSITGTLALLVEDAKISVHTKMSFRKGKCTLKFFGWLVLCSFVVGYFDWIYWFCSLVEYIDCIIGMGV